MDLTENNEGAKRCQNEPKMETKRSRKGTKTGKILSRMYKIAVFFDGRVEEFLYINKMRSHQLIKILTADTFTYE